MKKYILLAAFAISLISGPSISHAVGNITLNDCSSWKSATDTRTKDNLEKTPSLIRNLIQAQNNSTSWSKNKEILSLDWEKVKEIENASDWSKEDSEYIMAIQACQHAMEKESSSAEMEAFLKKATLHIERSTQEYIDVERKLRTPFVRHGGVLPGSTARGEASDYVENKFIPKFVNGTLLFILSLSVVMLVVGGMMFVFAGGDSDATSQAKTTIMWAIIGTIITILAYAIVQFVIGIDFSI